MTKSSALVGQRRLTWFGSPTTYRLWWQQQHLKLTMEETFLGLEFLKFWSSLPLNSTAAVPLPSVHATPHAPPPPPPQQPPFLLRAARPPPPPPLSVPDSMQPVWRHSHFPVPVFTHLWPPLPLSSLLFPNPHSCVPAGKCTLRASRRKAVFNNATLNSLPPPPPHRHRALSVPAIRPITASGHLPHSSCYRETEIVEQMLFGFKGGWGRGGGGGGRSNELLFDHRNYKTSKHQRFINIIRKKKKKKRGEKTHTHACTHAHTHTDTKKGGGGGRGILTACCSCRTQE